jgi:hypothetical protein
MIPLRAFLIVKNSRADVELARTSPQTSALNINLTADLFKHSMLQRKIPSENRHIFSTSKGV